MPATAWQIADIERKLERAEKELARLTELKEVRTVRSLLPDCCVKAFAIGFCAEFPATACSTWSRMRRCRS